MKFAPALKLLACSTFALSSLASVHGVKAASPFEEQAVVQEQYIAIAAPFGEGKYNLVVMEQIPDKQTCWNESGTGPVVVEPMWLTFDFTGHCRRGTDPNAYSIRMDGRDMGLDYILRITPRGSDLVLIGTPRVYGNGPEIELGRTQGMSRGYLKIFLNPGWQFTKRTYQGKVLGHVYFSGSQANIATPETSASDSTSVVEDLAPATDELAPAAEDLTPSTDELTPDIEDGSTSDNLTPKRETPLQEKIFVPAAPTIRSNSSF